MTQPAQQQLRQTSFPAMCLVEYALAQLAQAGIEERGLIFTRDPVTSTEPMAGKVC
jgi:hypothetical protein